MATINWTYTEIGDHAEVTWEALATSDDGQWYELNNYNDNTVTISGTFDSNTVTMQGANADDQSDAFTLTDHTGVGIALTAAGGRLIAEAPKYIRPLNTAGTTDIDVKVQLRRS